MALNKSVSINNSDLFYSVIIIIILQNKYNTTDLQTKYNTNYLQTKYNTTDLQRNTTHYWSAKKYNTLLICKEIKHY